MRRLFVCLLAAAAVPLALQPCVAQAAAAKAVARAADLPRAAAQTEALLAAFRAQAAGGTAAPLEDFFDFDRLCDRPLEGHKKLFSPQQMQRMRRAFRALVPILTQRSGQSLGKNPTKLGDATLVGELISVPVTVTQPEEEADGHVAFFWAAGPRGLRIVDVALDGASVSLDYENQFGRVLRKDGADALIRKMQARLAEAQKAP